MNDAPGYTPPKVWTWDAPSGGQFENINRPTAGAQHDKVLPVGKHPLQLYSLATPNGVKVTIMLEELLAAGHRGAEYDAWVVNIREGDQFGSGFVDINPNSKIPALVDTGMGRPTRVFESAPSCSTSPTSSAPSFRRIPRTVRNACRGCSGRWAPRPISAAASGISTPMRP